MITPKTEKEMKIVHRDLVLFGDPRLACISTDVQTLDERVVEILHDMTRILINKNAAGIAAPQVGENLNIILLSPRVQGWDSAKHRHIHVLINPVLTPEGDKRILISEGCLSLPRIRETVERPAVIKVRALDHYFEPVGFISDGLQARVIQHEYDHLVGKTMLDYLTPERLDFNKQEIRRIRKQQGRSMNHE
jgi:peptide deformylase